MEIEQKHFCMLHKQVESYLDIPHVAMLYKEQVALAQQPKATPDPQYVLEQVFY